MDITDSVVVVTGAASGLGEATARSLAKAGAIVVLADIDLSRGSALADELGATFVRTDVGDANSADEVAAAASSLGAVRGLVNCAGSAGVRRRILRANGTRFDPDDFERTVRLNLTGSFLMIRALAPVIAAAPVIDDDGSRGAIINVASVAGIVGPAGVAPYSASKAGVIGLTYTTARDLAQYGIRAVAIAPGPMETPLFHTFAPEARAAMAEGCTFPKRPGRVSEFAMLVEHILQNDYLNATCIRLDGGIGGP